MSGRNGNAALLVLRLMVGWLFLWHGLGKFFGPPFAGVGFDAYSAILSVHLGSMSDSTIIALAAGTATVETAGGLLLLLGWHTGTAASILMLQQIANVAVLKFDNGVFGPLGWEDQLVTMAALFAMMLGGPGAAAMDTSSYGPAASSGAAAAPPPPHR